MIVDQITFTRFDGTPFTIGKILRLDVLGKEADGSEFKHGLEVKCGDMGSDELEGIAQLFRVLGKSFSELAKERLGATPEDRAKKLLE